MKSGHFAILTALVALSACSSGEETSKSEQLIERVEPPDMGDDGVPTNQFGFQQAIYQGPDPFGANTPRAREAVSDAATRTINVEEPGTDAAARPAVQPQQIAYSYGFGFQIDADKIPELQRAHVKLCESMAEKCRVLRMSEAGVDDWDAYGELTMQVASDSATMFGDGLAKPAAELGGELVSSVRDGEDLSEQIVDTEARLAAKLLLRDKLTAILRGNRGSVDELVKAEQAIAEVNEEIDSTRSKLEKFRGRIRYSDVRIEYEPYFGDTQLGFSRPVVTAFQSIGTTLGVTLAAIVYFLTAAVPIVLLILGLRWILHRFGLRIRFWKKDPVASEST